MTNGLSKMAPMILNVHLAQLELVGYADTLMENTFSQSLGGSR